MDQIGGMTLALCRPVKLCMPNQNGTGQQAVLDSRTINPDAECILTGFWPCRIAETV